MLHSTVKLDLFVNVHRNEVFVATRTVSEQSRQVVDSGKCCHLRAVRSHHFPPPPGCLVVDVPSSICSPFPGACGAGPLSGREWLGAIALQRSDFEKSRKQNWRNLSRFMVIIDVGPAAYWNRWHSARSKKILKLLVWTWIWARWGVNHEGKSWIYQEAYIVWLWPWHSLMKGWNFYLKTWIILGSKLHKCTQLP